MQVFSPLFFPVKDDYRMAYVRGDTIPPVYAAVSNNQAVSIKFDRKWKSKSYQVPTVFLKTGIRAEMLNLIIPPLREKLNAESGFRHTKKNPLVTEIL